jgi:hypothetical protein
MVKTKVLGLDTIEFLSPFFSYLTRINTFDLNNPKTPNKTPSVIAGSSDSVDFEQQCH